MSHNLNNEEKEILGSFELGEWKSVSNLDKRKQELKGYATATIRKDKRLNIRISSRDLNELRRKATHEGLPYQTYIASILHKFVNGRLVEPS
jgi:predicted DNA binding CopG/RHH family protein